MNKRAEAAASAEVQTIGRPPSSSVPNAAHLSTPNKNAKASSSSLPTPPKSTTNKSNPRRREPSPDWPDELVEDEEEGDGATARKARELDSDDDGSGDYKATEMEKRRKAIEENMKRMRAEQNTPEPSAKSSSSKPTSTGTLQTPPVSPTKIQSTSSLADKKTIDFLRSANSKLRDEKTSLEKEVKQLEGEYAELVDEVCGLKAKESDWEEEREKWGRRVEVLEGGKRVGK
ncbi:hypothetical protein BDY24DRAFT_7743 [Mrakia frigida]|uniref:Gfd1p n=1 Tax=Mrakia frigida TaxID=29902 RepID=UPI003FCBF6F2